MTSYEDRVIIVGAGPVGLMTAYRLSRFGIPCVVIDQLQELPRDLRASTFHPPTLDMLSEYGLSEPLIQQGLICPSWQIRMHQTDDRVVFDLSALSNDTDHPYRLQCEQFRLCQILESELRLRQGVDLRLGLRLLRIEQHADGVVAHAQADGAPVRLTGRVLVGADGANGAVRSLMGLEFQGKTYPETTILATTTFPFEDHLSGLSNVNYVWFEHGTFSLLRLPSVWRCSLYPEAGEAIEDAIQHTSIQRKLQKIVSHPGHFDVLQSRSYRVHMRIVDDYRRGRVVLAGDAAHVNSPSGGMGMNGGLHDAFNLTAKLKQIWDGADLSLLDQYTRQRRPVAENEILVQADRNRSRMQERDPNRRREMLLDLQKVAQNPQQAREYLLRSSMIEGLRNAREAA